MNKFYTAYCLELPLHNDILLQYHIMKL